MLLAIACPWRHRLTGPGAASALPPAPLATDAESPPSSEISRRHQFTRFVSCHTPPAALSATGLDFSVLVTEYRRCQILLTACCQTLQPPIFSNLAQPPATLNALYSIVHILERCTLG